MEDRLDLNSLTVLAPCKANWTKMPGDAATRFCERCGKHVHNLSACTTSDAEKLVQQADDHTCVRIERDVTGKVITLDYSPPPPRSAGLRWGVVLTIVSSFAAVV